MLNDILARFNRPSGLALLLVLFGAGCSGRDTGNSSSASSSSTGGVSTCVPGTQAACACGGGVEGYQVCTPAGTFGLCQCPGASSRGASSNPATSFAQGSSTSLPGSTSSAGSSTAATSVIHTSSSAPASSSITSSSSSSNGSSATSEMVSSSAGASSLTQSSSASGASSTTSGSSSGSVTNNLGFEAGTFEGWLQTGDNFGTLASYQVVSTVEGLFPSEGNSMAYVTSNNTSFNFLHLPTMDFSSFTQVCFDLRLLTTSANGSPGASGVEVIGKQPMDGQPLLASLAPSLGSAYRKVNYITGEQGTGDLVPISGTEPYAYATSWETFCFAPSAVTGTDWVITSATLSFVFNFETGTQAYLVDNIRLE